MNNLLNTEKESYSFPKLLFHFDFVYSPNFSPHMGKSVLCVQVFWEKKIPFQSKQALILVKSLPHGHRDPQSRGSQPQEGGVARSSFSRCRHLGGLGSVKPGIPALLSRSTPSNRQLISFSFSN